jgi:hypothetical protein
MTGETSSWFMESRKGIPPYEEQVREELGFPTGPSQEPPPQRRRKVLARIAGTRARRADD